MPVGVYLHIPFCKRKCPYCDFYSIAAHEDLRHEYVLALAKRISAQGDLSLDVDTIYFGGGTPSLLLPDDIKVLIDTLSHSFNVVSDCEITMECNPSSVDLNKLTAYKAAGVNRLSFGVQSSNDTELVKLGRLHDFSLAKNAVIDAQSAGFENISCDLMIGTPLQTIESLCGSVSDICSLGVKHISCYMLKIEQGTAYDCADVRRSVADDDTVSDMYLALCKQLESLGYSQYEISNFCLDGYESKHNLKYWHCDEYLGFGPSAHSFYNGKRTYCGLDVKGFIADPMAPDEIEEYTVDKLEEYILLGLRLAEGISLTKIEELGGCKAKLLDTLKPFLKVEYATILGDNVRLTDEGFLRSNGIISKLIESQVGQS